MNVRLGVCYNDDDQTGCVQRLCLWSKTACFVHESYRIRLDFYFRSSSCLGSRIVPLCFSGFFRDWVGSLLLMVQYKEFRLSMLLSNIIPKCLEFIGFGHVCQVCILYMHGSDLFMVCYNKEVRQKIVIQQRCSAAVAWLFELKN